MPITLCPYCGKEADAAGRSPGSTLVCANCGRPAATTGGGAAVGAFTSHIDRHEAVATENRGHLTPTLVLDAPASADFLVTGQRGNIQVEGYAYLAPPRGPDELGWLAHYRILSELGRGGMGVVFAAEDTQLHRQVAVKVLAPDSARAPGCRDRFLREARAAAGVPGDHIVSIYQVGEDRGVPFIAMELLVGESLAGRLARQARQPLAEALRIGREVAAGLAAAHARGLIHRDIKPANVWLQAPADRVKLLDFGLAFQADDGQNLTQTGVVLGTPAYMAPEQADGCHVDARADLFSLGCVLYEMIAGQRPFNGPSALSVLKAVALNDPPPLADLGVEVPPAVEGYIRRLLAKKPDDRPPSAVAAEQAFRSLAGGDTETLCTQAPARPATAVARPPRRRRRLLLSLAGAFGALTVAGLLTAGWIRGGNSKSDAEPPAPPAEEEIVFGMSGPFSGPSRELGRSVECGIRTCFEQVNDAGGINGRQLRLVALDDGYDPDRALANTHELFEKYKALGVVGSVGTPTAQKVLPYIFEQDRLFFGAFTGAKLLRRQPPDRLVFNYRASYDEETAALVQYLLDVRRIPPQALAVFAQQDAYGEAGFEGVARTLRKRGYDADKVLRVGYARNSLNVSAAVEGVLARSDIRAVVMVAVYQPAARFIQRVRQARPEMAFCNVSFVGSEALVDELRELTGDDKAGTGVVVSQVVPPVDSNSSAVSRYRDLLKKYFPNERPNFTSLESFVAASVLTDGLRRAGPTPATNDLVTALESIQGLDLGIGTPLGFAPSEHQASHKVWGTRIDDSGALKEIDLH